MTDKQDLNFSWLLKMAWRDSRRNRSRLLLFVSSIIMGIAALVAIYSLGDNMRQEIDRQAATLLGADLEISGNKEPAASIKKGLDSLGGEQSEQRSFTSMVYFPKGGGSRLVQVRALGRCLSLLWRPRNRTGNSRSQLSQRARGGSRPNPDAAIWCPSRRFGTHWQYRFCYRGQPCLAHRDKPGFRHLLRRLYTFHFSFSKAQGFRKKAAGSTTIIISSFHRPWT